MKKTENLMIRIPSGMKEKIVEFCKKSKITQSEFIRNLIEKRDLESIKIFTNDEREFFEEINHSLLKIGTNINQIAHFLNLEHLKAFGNFKSLEDLIIIDQLKEVQIESLKTDLKKSQDLIKKLTQLLKDSYEQRN